MPQLLQHTRPPSAGLWHTGLWWCLGCAELRTWIQYQGVQSFTCAHTFCVCFTGSSCTCCQQIRDSDSNQTSRESRRTKALFAQQSHLETSDGDLSQHPVLLGPCQRRERMTEGQSGTSGTDPNKPTSRYSIPSPQCAQIVWIRGNLPAKPTWTPNKEQQLSSQAQSEVLEKSFFFFFFPSYTAEFRNQPGVL